MLRGMAYSLLAISIMLTDVAQALYVTVNPSWIDGKPTEYGGSIYISVDGITTLKNDYTFSKGDTLTFRAIVKPGREVTMWSRGAFSSTKVTEAKKVGHFAEIVDNDTDTLVWKMPGADQSLAVHQDWLKYDIVFDGNGATSGTATGFENIVYTNIVTLSTPFKKKGYSFVEWKMEESPKKTFVSGSKVSGESFGLSYTNKSVTLVAQWKANEYKVTFDANGGTFTNGGKTKTNTVVFDAAYGDFPTPIPPGGYDFPVSWTNTAGQTIKPTDIVKTDADHTLYARWTAKSAMRIEAIKCSDEEGANGTVTGSGSFLWGGTCTLQATPSTGSHFVRWTKNAQNGTTISTEEVYSFAVTEAATYYGHFALDRYTVTFNFRDANGNPTSTVQQVAHGHAAVEPKPPRYPENEFDVWDSYDFKTVTANLNINAQYKSTVLTVTFETQGGTSVSPNPRRWEKDERYDPLPTTTKEGYKMKEDAWWTAENGGDKITTNSIVAKAGEQTLYARWTALQYAVTFDPNGGTITSGTGSKTVTFGETYGTLNGAKRDGYNFDGWWSDSGEQITSGSTVTIPQDHVLTAKWNAKSWWVSLYPMGGSVDSDEIFVTYDQPYSGLEDATRSGYDFLGWYTSSTGGTQIKNGQRVKNASITSLYAHWKAKTYVVTFDPCGGSVSETSREVEYQSQYGGASDPLPVPARIGYEFQGWYTEASGGSRVYASTIYTRTDDQTLYAHWRAKAYTVVFDQNGGAGNMSDQAFTWDVSQNLIGNSYAKTGYTFRGWGESADATTVRYVDRQNVSNLTENTSIRLYALWTTNTYTISFDGNGGIGSMESISAKYDTPVKLPKNVFTFGVNKFKGWRGPKEQDYGDEAIVSNLTAVANDTVTLTAKWSDDYVVRFLPNGATNTVMANQNIPMLERTRLNPNEYVRPGYTYMGWATNLVTAQRHEVVYRDGASVLGLGESGAFVDLYAVWANNSYRVRFHPNGGEGDSFDRTFVYDKVQKLPDGSTFTKVGQILKGWVTDPTNAVYMAAGSSVSNLTSTADGAVSLYAKWEPVEPVSSEWAKAADSNVELSPVSETGCSIETDKGYPKGNDTCLQFKPGNSNLLVKAGVRMPVSGTGTLSLYFKEDFVKEYGEIVDKNAFFDISYDVKSTTEIKALRKRPTIRAQWEGPRTFVISNVQSYVELAVSARYNGDLEYSIRLDGISWVPDKATIGVTYRINDGTAAPADIVSNATYVVGKAIGALPALSGENFMGWSTNTTSAGKIDATWIVPATDAQLYAVWDSGEHPDPTQEDAPTIGSVSLSEAGFGISFLSDNRFDYRVLSASSLETPIEWTPDETTRQRGTGEVLTFTVPTAGSGGAGQKFFKVEVLRRETK